MTSDPIYVEIELSAKLYDTLCKECELTDFVKVEQYIVYLLEKSYEEEKHLARTRTVPTKRSTRNHATRRKENT